MSNTAETEWLKKDDTTTGSIADKVEFYGVPPHSAEVPLPWTRGKPTVSGTYLYKNDREWIVRYLTVRLGNWRMAQDPGLYYADGKPVDRMDDGWWAGPLQAPPEGGWQ